MTDRQLWYYMATSGHGRWSLRSEVDDQALETVTESIREARLSGDGSAELLPGYRVRMLSEGSEAASWEIFSGSTQLATCHLLWAGMPEGTPSPLLSVARSPGLASDPPSTAWLTDCERCIAWALLEERRGR